MPVSNKECSPCPIDAMLSVIGGRGKGTILWRLADGPMRTGALRRSIPGITERMLIRHLHDLVGDGIVTRRQEQSVPPRVYYSISKYGWTLVPVLDVIGTWGRRHLRRTQGRSPQRGGGRQAGSEALAKMHATVHHLKAKGTVGVA
jgi:DNA-binding HxlR family transcriptional regulator